MGDGSFRSRSFIRATRTDMLVEKTIQIAKATLEGICTDLDSLCLTLRLQLPTCRFQQVRMSLSSECPSLAKGHGLTVSFLQISDTCTTISFHRVTIQSDATFPSQYPNPVRSKTYRASVQVLLAFWKQRRL